MIQPRKNYSRREDMSPDGKLSIMAEDDGDIIVTVFQDENSMGDGGMASVQFCTGAGGGRSPKTRKALIALAEAIAEDNKDFPLFDGDA